MLLPLLYHRYVQTAPGLKVYRVAHSSPVGVGEAIRLPPVSEQPRRGERQVPQPPGTLTWSGRANRLPASHVFIQASGTKIPTSPVQKSSFFLHTCTHFASVPASYGEVTVYMLGLPVPRGTSMREQEEQWPLSLDSAAPEFSCGERLGSLNKQIGRHAAL